jgi:hypothetical protein
VTRRRQAFECVYAVEERVAVLVTEIGMQGKDEGDDTQYALARPERDHRVPGTFWHGAGRASPGQCRACASLGHVPL